MNLNNLLESTKQIKKTRASEYGRIRIAGEDVRMHVAVRATGKSEKELRAMKNLPMQDRIKKEQSLIKKIKEFKNKHKEVDHQNKDKNNNAKSNLKTMNKSSHTAKTNRTR